jgi:hypothetical protein
VFAGSGNSCFRTTSPSSDKLVSHVIVCSQNCYLLPHSTPCCHTAHLCTVSRRKKCVPLLPFVSWSGMYPSRSLTTINDLLYVSRMMKNDDYFEAISVILGRGNRSTRRKLAPVPLSPPQISLDLSRSRTCDLLSGATVPLHLNHRRPVKYESNSSLLFVVLKCSSRIYLQTLFSAS